MIVRGTVKWFNDKKGYGFISRSDGQGDVFVHFTEIEGNGHRSLIEGQLVEFECVSGAKGPAAEQVRKVADEG